MSLPRLPSFDDNIIDKLPSFDNAEVINNVSKESPKNEEKSESKMQNKKKFKEKKQLRIPKAEYDTDGVPTLTIPDLDDVNLLGEIEKYFGMEVD